MHRAGSAVVRQRHRKSDWQRVQCIYRPEGQPFCLINSSVSQQPIRVLYSIFLSILRRNSSMGKIVSGSALSLALLVIAPGAHAFLGTLLASAFGMVQSELTDAALGWICFQHWIFARRISVDGARGTVLPIRELGIRVSSAGVRSVRRVFYGSGLQRPLAA